MKAIVPRLPDNYLILFLRRFAQYDTMRGRNKIEAVTTFKSVDKALTEAFEKFVYEI